MPTKKQRRSTLDDTGNIDAPLGSKPWSIAIMLRIRSLSRTAESDVKFLKSAIKSAETNNAWKVLGYASLDLALTKESEMDPEMVAAVKDSSDGQAVGAVLGKWGGDRKSEDQGNNITLKQRGTSMEYTIARLKRDNIDLYKSVCDGEMSANKAAKLVG